MISNVNKRLWQNYKEFGGERGRLVATLLSERIKIAGASILDFGCGEGAVALELAAAGATVVAFDTNKAKLARLRQAASQSGASLKIVEQAPTDTECFDAAILLDVIEHLVQPDSVLNHLHSVLKPDGIIYLSTPNKLSPINALCDPHFSLPFVSLLSRKQVKFITAHLLRRQPKERTDFPQLFSMRRLFTLLNESGFAPAFVNRAAARYAFRRPRAIWNRDWHLKVVASARKAGWTKIVERNLSDSWGLFNMWLNPTWYIIAKKKPDAGERRAM